MRKRPLTAMLTVLGALAASLAIAACGGKESSGTKEGSSTKAKTSSSLSAKPTEEKAGY